MKDMMTVTDIHCHLLPKVDDGACDSSMTRAMLKKAYNEGVRDIIVTPHFRRGMFETPADIIRKRFQKVRVYAANLGEEGIRLHLGCEYYREIGMAEKLKRGFRPTLAGGKYVLVEFSSMDSYARIRSELYELVTAGYIPIVAHAERYDAFLRSLDNISNAIALGAQIQVNADSILGKNGGRAKKCARCLWSGKRFILSAQMHMIYPADLPELESVRIMLKKNGEEMPLSGFFRKILIKY